MTRCYQNYQYSKSFSMQQNGFNQNIFWANFFSFVISTADNRGINIGTAKSWSSQPVNQLQLFFFSPIVESSTYPTNVRGICESKTSNWFHLSGVPLIEPRLYFKKNLTQTKCYLFAALTHQDHKNIIPLKVQCISNDIIWKF